MHNDEILGRLQEIERLEISHRAETESLRSQLASSHLDIARLQAALDRSQSERLVSAEQNTVATLNITSALKSTRCDAGEVMAKMKRLEAELKLANADVLYYKGKI